MFNALIDIFLLNKWTINVFFITLNRSSKGSNKNSNSFGVRAILRSESEIHFLFRLKLMNQLCLRPFHIIQIPGAEWNKSARSGMIFFLRSESLMHCWNVSFSVWAARLTRADELGTRVDSMPVRIALFGKISVSARVNICWMLVLL